MTVRAVVGIGSIALWCAACAGTAQPAEPAAAAPTRLIVEDDPVEEEVPLEDGRRVTMISLSAPVVMGSLSKEDIQRVVNGNVGQLRYCYEMRLLERPDLEGRIAVRFVVAATGGIAKAVVSDSTVKDEVLEACVRGRIEGWHFPPPSGGGIVEINYPFVFLPN